MRDQTPQGVKKETVYQGPSMKQETVFQGRSGLGMKETVYGGPAGKETVFNENRVTVRKPDTTVARAAMAKSTRASAIRFLIVAALSALEFFSYKGESEGVSNTSLLTAIVFLVLAVYAYKMSRGAFLAAIVIYGISTLVMVGVAFTSEGGILFVLKPLIARCILIYNLHQKYCQLTDLYDVENS